jgi:hypothetical protein
MVKEMVEGVGWRVRRFWVGGAVARARRARTIVFDVVVVALCGRVNFLHWRRYGIEFGFGKREG